MAVGNGRGRKYKIVAYKADIKVHFYFSFIAYDIVNIFKRALTEKYRNAGIEVLRLDILHKIAVICFNGRSLKFEFNRKYELRSVLIKLS